MEKLCQRIGYTKRKFTEISTLLDETYRTIQEEKKRISSPQKTIKEKIIKRIEARMIYLNREHKAGNDIKLAELAKLLDWLVQQ